MTTQRRTKNRPEPLSDEELQQLVRRYEAGEYVKALAAETGYSWAGMHAALKRQGVEFRGRRGPSPKKVTADDPRATKALQLWDEGMSYVRAAEQVGLASITLRRLLVESGRDPHKHWKGEGARNWNGGRHRLADGYIRVPTDDLTAPMGGTRGTVLEHRAVMAHSLGRPLLPDETVHHKNGKRDDNHLANLELWLSRHPKGQRVSELREFAKEILALYPD